LGKKTWGKGKEDQMILFIAIKVVSITISSVCAGFGLFIGYKLAGKLLEKLSSKNLTKKYKDLINEFALAEQPT